VDYAEIRALTNKMHQQISAGTFDSPSWDILRSAKLAARIYAPLGTSMSLGDFVRLVRAYIDVFKTAQGGTDHIDAQHLEDNKVVNDLRDDLKVRYATHVLSFNFKALF
jgi:glycerol-3-phosphate O-acyltransferase/dihydroxyacetone phosphate acyltransferase